MGLEQNWNAGGQGSNFTWQRAMLQELGANNDQLKLIVSSLGGGFPVSTQRTKETRNVIAAGVGIIAAGARKVDFANYGNTDALVDGVVIPSGLSVPYVAGLNDTLPAFTYDAQTSTLLITIIS